METEFDAGFGAEVLEKEFHFVGFVDEDFGAGAAAGVAGVEVLADFIGEARFVEVEDPGEQSGGPHAAKAAVGIEESDVGSGAGGGDGGGDSGGAGTANDDVGVIDEGEVASGFVEGGGVCRG